MLCDACEGWGNPQKKKIYSKDEMCRKCYGSGQIPHADDQTFIVAQKKGTMVEVFAVQGNWRKESLGKATPGDKKHFYAILEKIRTQPNVKISQARTEINSYFKLEGNYA